MRVPRIVIDTHVFLSALRSRRGASFKLLSLVGGRQFQISVSVPLVLEYEEAAKGHLRDTALTRGDIDDILDYVCRVANHHEISYLWRPFLRDPKDDFILELAVEAGCDTIVTYNKRDFAGAERFGVQVLTPREFLQKRGLLS